MHPRHLAGWLLAALLLGACGPDVPVVRVEAQPSPTTSPTEVEVTPSPSPTSTSPSPTASETTPRPATDTDRARFVAAYAPESASHLQHVATDLDGDGTEDLLFAYVRGDRMAHVDVAWWNGTGYEIGFADDGGDATRIDRLRVEDVNDDGRTEVVTSQSGADGAGSVSVWQVTGAQQLGRLPAAGGCAGGSHTYGVTGATLEDRDADGVDEIYATCPDGTTARYRWETGAYRHAPQLVR